MSDLQCPARFLLFSEPDAAMAQTLRHERVAAVYAGPPGASDPPDGPGAHATDGSDGQDGSAVPGATALGDALGLPMQALACALSQADVLSEDPGAVGELRDLADLHRGETVVVLAMGAPGQRVDVVVDGDGVSVRQVSPGVPR